jgi:hypothetical protein
MGETTEKVMDNVMKISELKDHKKQLADAVLIKRGDGDGYQRSIQGDDATFKNASFGEDDGDFSNKSTVKRLKAHMQGLDTLDSAMQDVLFKMVGALSTDDVVGQRLAHVTGGLVNLEMGLTRMLDNDGCLLGEGEMNALFAEILAATRKSYTMPEEHHVLDEVFGKTGSSKS